jgi:hypothetical protein
MLFKSETVRQALLVVVLSSSLVLLVTAQSTYDTEEFDYNQRSENPDETKSQDVPKFISKSQSINAVLGQTIAIECIVNKLEGNQLMWSVKYDNDLTAKSPQILSVGDHQISGTPGNIEIKDITNNSIIAGSELTVKNVGQNDAGKYICTIAIEYPKEVQFHVVIVNEHQTEVTPTNALTSATSAIWQTAQFLVNVIFMGILLCATI